MHRPDMIPTSPFRQPPASPSAATVVNSSNVCAIAIAAAPALSVVSPCYNEQESLTELYGRLTEICKEQTGESYEIVLVDDGSADSTRSMIAHYCRADPHLVGVLLSRNYGHQLALSAGLQICRGDRILVIDADLQDPPELLGDMIKLMDDEKADVVYGQRLERRGESAFKRLSARLFYRLLHSLVDVEIPLDTGDFRLMSRRALDQLNRMPEQHRFIRGMVSWIGFRQVALKYERHARFAGETKYPLKKMVRFALDAISGFSIVPLRLATYLGFICSLFGLVFLGWTAYSYISGIAIQGWTTLMTVVLILGSGQLFVLGLIGEYLGRLYMQSKNRPLFIIEEILSQRREDGLVQENRSSVAPAGGVAISTF
jgi:glycosyltransferase involved in cell wall biosynthesis